MECWRFRPAIRHRVGRNPRTRGHLLWFSTSAKRLAPIAARAGYRATTLDLSQLVRIERRGMKPVVEHPVRTRRLAEAKCRGAGDSRISVAQRRDLAGRHLVGRPGQGPADPHCVSFDRSGTIAPTGPFPLPSSVLRCSPDVIPSWSGRVKEQRGTSAPFARRGPQSRLSMNRSAHVGSDFTALFSADPAPRGRRSRRKRPSRRARASAGGNRPASPGTMSAPCRSHSVSC